MNRTSEMLFNATDGGSERILGGAGIRVLVSLKRRSAVKALLVFVMK